MLLKSKISEHQLSLDPLLNEKYFAAKLGKFTSSEFHYLMAEKGIGSAGLNYIYRKVGEVMTGLPARADISTAATEHGLTYEREGLIKFGEKMGLQSLLVQRLILSDDGYCGGTPDGLIVLNESIDKLSYNVQPAEIKCPLSFDGYIRLWKCKTPEDLKKEAIKERTETKHESPYESGSLQDEMWKDIQKAKRNKRIAQSKQKENRKQ